MLKRFCASFLILLCAHAPARADDFTHYVLALSWNAAWCDREGDASNAPQCDIRHDYGFTLHGLWPQGEDGWPEYCRTRERDPSRRMTREMEDIMGSGGLAWHQWKKHGRCSELSAKDYFSLSREAYTRINRPAILRKITRPLDVSPAVIADAFLEANPEMPASSLFVTCKSQALSEVRICLDRSLNFRACAPRSVRACKRPAISISPMR